uniref:Fibronectin type-III domain-containing protein n=1 Tax=Heterorhabditis bacteriophora TaxID=37862 RepID=A0A1I7WX98_HETBA
MQLRWKREGWKENVVTKLKKSKTMIDGAYFGLLNRESRYLLPPERSSSQTSREKSYYSEQSGIDGKRSREESYVTPSQSSRRDMDERRDGLEMTEIGISSSRTSSYKTNSLPLETKFTVSYTVANYGGYIAWFPVQAHPFGTCTKDQDG